MTGWTQFSFAIDWQRPARQMIATGFWYSPPTSGVTTVWALSVWLRLWVARLSHQSVADTWSRLQRGWMPTFPSSTVPWNRDAAEDAGVSVGEYISASSPKAP